MEISETQLSDLAALADDCDALVQLATAPDAGAAHLAHLQDALRTLAMRIKAMVVGIGGDDPWRDEP